jgi:ATP-dependent DNA helicase RecG
MNPSLQKLQKFFKLESERGYDNRAVVGGLERMLDPWEAEARADGLPEELISAVVSRLRDYHRLSTASRQEVLQGLWRRIQRGTEEEISPTIPPATELEAPYISPSTSDEEVEIDIEVIVKEEALPMAEQPEPAPQPNEPRQHPPNIPSGCARCLRDCPSWRRAPPWNDPQAIGTRDVGGYAL